MAENAAELNQLRQWAHEQQPVLNSLDTDEFLLRFLRVTDFDLQRAKEWLVYFWKYRTENPQWFTNRDLLHEPDMLGISELGYCLQLPRETKDKQLIFLMRIAQYDPARYSFDAMTKYAFAVTDILNSQPAAQLHGFIILLDFSHLRIQHVNSFTPDVTRRYVQCWEKMYPVHLRQIHFYNYPGLFDPILHLFRMFLNRKLSETIHFHAKGSDGAVNRSLHQFLDPAILPQEYGGELGSVDAHLNKSFVQWTRDNHEQMSQLDGRGVDLTQISNLLKTLKKGNGK